MTWTWPAKTIEMVPPKEQMHLDVSFSIGMLASRQVTAPGNHGAAVVGVQACGVSTPLAADVAEAVAGLAREVHMANGGMFTKGL